MNILRKFWRLDIYSHMIMMLSILAVVGIFQHEAGSTVPQLLISVSVAVTLNLVINYLKDKKIYYSKSATISGLIVAMALPRGIIWYIPLCAAAIAIISKHIIKIGRKHIFNPANLGLLLGIIIFGKHLAWWASPWWLVVILGLIISYKFRRLPLTLSFIALQGIIFLVWALIKEMDALSALSFINFFFVFVMLVEPKTSPVKRKGRIIYGIIAAITSSILIIFFLAGYPYDPFVTSLAFANIFVPVLNSKMK